jgi:hypothetical protein
VVPIDFPGKVRILEFDCFDYREFSSDRLVRCYQSIKKDFCIVVSWIVVGYQVLQAILEEHQRGTRGPMAGIGKGLQRQRRKIQMKDIIVCGRSLDRSISEYAFDLRSLHAESVQVENLHVELSWLLESTSGQRGHSRENQGYALRVA